MARKLLPGATVSLSTSAGAPIARLLIGAHWLNIGVDIDMCCLLLGADMRVPSREHFLFRNHRVSPDRTAFLRYLPPNQVSGPDRAQILLDLEAMPRQITRALVAMSALRPGGTLPEMGNMRTRVMDIDSGETVYIYAHEQMRLAGSCMTLWELERRGTIWDARISARPYPGGPPGLVRDHGAR